MFRYKKYMRDGSVEERTAVPDPKRVRTGKTQRDNKKRHRGV